MAKNQVKKARNTYKTVGITSDGVRVLKPATRPTQFTTAEIRSTIGKVLREMGIASGPQVGNIYVEPRETGDFAVRRQNSLRASAVLPTQKEAIARAKELAPGKAPIVKRVRNVETGDRGRWRKS